MQTCVSQIPHPTALVGLVIRLAQHPRVCLPSVCSVVSSTTTTGKAFSLAQPRCTSVVKSVVASFPSPTIMVSSITSTGRLRSVVPVSGNGSQPVIGGSMSSRMGLSSSVYVTVVSRKRSLGESRSLYVIGVHSGIQMLSLLLCP